MRVVERDSSIMKNIKIGLIVLLCVIIVGLCGIFVCGVSGMKVFRGHERQNYNDVQLVLEEEIPLAGIDNISILYSMNSNDIYLAESEGDVVLIREYSSCELSESEVSTVKTNGSSLEVRGVRRNYSGMRFFGVFGPYYVNERHYTEVCLPASFQGELLLETASGDITSDFDIKLEKTLSAASSSGDIHFLSVNADGISLSSSSGNVMTGDVITNIDGSSGEISIQTASGDMNLEELRGETKMESSSGEMTVDVIVGNARLGTASGDMIINEIQGEMIAESSSGNITVMAITGNSQIKTVSGDVEVRQMEGDARVTTSSGYVKILAGSGDRAVSTVSGDIVVTGSEGDFQADAQSGNIQMDIQSGEGSIGSTSGEIQLGLRELTGKLDINSISGSVSINLSTENEFGFTADTTSGSIMTFFDNDLEFSSRKKYAQGTYGVNMAGNQVEIKTTSGDVVVSAY